MVCWCSCRSLISDAAALYSKHSSLVEIEPTIFNQIVVSWLYCRVAADHRPRCTHFVCQNKFTTFAGLYSIDYCMFVWMTKPFKMDNGYPYILSLPTYQTSGSLSITSSQFSFWQISSSFCFDVFFKVCLSMFQCVDQWNYTLRS